jgi:hypothetical protein
MPLYIYQAAYTPPSPRSGSRHGSVRCSAEPGLITHRNEYGWARSCSVAYLRLFSTAWCVLCSRYYGPVSEGAYGWPF